MKTTQGVLKVAWNGNVYYDNEASSMYKDTYPQRLMEWFEAESRKVNESLTLLDGTVTVLPPDPPTIARFIRDVSRPEWGVASKMTIWTWQQEHPELRAAVDFGLLCYEAWLDRMTCAGAIPSGWATLAAKNRLGWIDRTDITSKGEKLPSGAQVAIGGSGTTLITSPDVANTLAATMTKLGLTAPSEVSPNAGETPEERITNASQSAETPTDSQTDEF